MNAIDIKAPTYLDVEFYKLNNLTGRLRTAKAKVSVKKLGTLYRIIVLQQPLLASLEQILSYIEDQGQFLDNNEILKTTDSPNNKISVLTNPNDVQPIPLKNASLDLLKALEVEKLKQLASTHKLAGRSKMNAEKLATSLLGLVTENELA